jgi:hypothetical protein
MSRAEFEPTIPVFDWAKTVHALDRPATVIDKINASCITIQFSAYRREPANVKTH